MRCQISLNMSWHWINTPQLFQGVNTFSPKGIYLFITLFSKSLTGVWRVWMGHSGSHHVHTHLTDGGALSSWRRQESSQDKNHVTDNGAQSEQLSIDLQWLVTSGHKPYQQNLPLGITDHLKYSGTCTVRLVYTADNHLSKMCGKLTHQTTSGFYTCLSLIHL